MKGMISGERATENHLRCLGGTESRVLLSMYTSDDKSTLCTAQICNSCSEMHLHIFVGMNVIPDPVLQVMRLSDASCDQIDHPRFPLVYRDGDGRDYLDIGALSRAIDTFHKIAVLEIKDNPDDPETGRQILESTREARGFADAVMKHHAPIFAEAESFIGKVKPLVRETDNKAPEVSVLAIDNLDDLPKFLADLLAGAQPRDKEAEEMAAKFRELAGGGPKPRPKRPKSK